nr:hypothetical protein [Tanacetum cinerariifolium]
MSSITAQQTKLDLEFVPKENQLDIRKCNGRIPRGLKPKEETFQVVLHALCTHSLLSGFVITADVPEVYMHQFWNSVYKHPDFYRFKIDEKKRFKLNLESSNEEKVNPTRIILAMLQDQDFDALPSEEDTVSFLRELGHKEKGKRVKRSAKKSSTTPTIGIVIREPPAKTQSKRKEKVDVAHGKGIDMLSEVALTKVALMKEVRKESLRDFHKSHPIGVLDVMKDESTESESESWGNDEADSNNEEGSEQKNDTEEHESDFEQDTNGSESDSESNHQDDDDDEVNDDNDDDEDVDEDDENNYDKSEGDCYKSLTLYHFITDLD